MRPSASSGPRDGVPSSLAENDQAGDEVPSGLKPRGRATSMIRRATPATRVPDPEPPAEHDDPPSSGRVLTVPAEEPQAAAEASDTTPAPPPVEHAVVRPPTPSAAHRSMLADPTQSPPGAVASSSDATPLVASTPAKPLLASEALMEDLAPVEPARRDARVWCAACGIGFVLFGALPLVGLLPGALAAAVPWLVTGAISLIAGAARVTYRQRAIAMLETASKIEGIDRAAYVRKYQTEIEAA